MTREEKEEYIIDEYSKSKNKKRFCEKMSKHLEKKGCSPVSWHSIQSNWFSRGMFPKDDYKINILYGFTTSYVSKIRKQTEKKAEHGTLVHQASHQQ